MYSNYLTGDTKLTPSTERQYQVSGVAAEWTRLKKVDGAARAPTIIVDLVMKQTSLSTGVYKMTMTITRTTSYIPN